MTKKTSEFGKGFIYNLVLFSKHWWRHFEDFKRSDEMAEKNPELWTKGSNDLWFNGAGDHFFEFEIPKQFQGTKIGKLAQELQDEAIKRRLGSITLKELSTFFEKLEELCMLIDKKLGVIDIKADNN